MKSDRNEEGMIMVEAIYVVVITIVVIFFAVNVGVVFHNRMVVTASANEAASGVARVYSALDKEPFYGYMDTTDFVKIYPYRYLRYGDTYTDVTQRKAKWYASYLIYNAEFAAQKSMNFDDVVTECRTNEIGQRVLYVTIKRKYPMFDMNPMTFFGLNPEYEVEATGTAVCYDVIHQMNKTAFIDELQSIVTDNAVGESLDNILDIIIRIRRVFE
ncbi:MAG: hypothetical protein NC416_08865 [Eubacterium sp.]|nr:hypothetical protein [Eubacterium sp.]